VLTEFRSMNEDTLSAWVLDYLVDVLTLAERVLELVDVPQERRSGRFRNSWSAAVTLRRVQYRSYSQRELRGKRWQRSLAWPGSLCTGASPIRAWAVSSGRDFPNELGCPLSGEYRSVFLARGLGAWPEATLTALQAR
jgi:hypothetical protein